MNGKKAMWKVTVGPRGLEIRAGRHLRVSMSPTMMFWLASLAGAIGTSPYWTYWLA